MSCVSDTSIDSTDAATAALVDEESGENTARKWHIVSTVKILNIGTCMSEQTV